MSKKFLLLFVFCCSCSVFYAQHKSYRAEAGLLGGTAHYLGDANVTPFTDNAFVYGGLLRYRFDSRLALRTEFTRSVIKKTNSTVLNFENSVMAFDMCGEFNFFDLDKNRNKRFSRIFSPYIFAGVGMMNYSYESNNQVGASIPFGVGMKLKLPYRFYLNLQYSNRLLLRDNLEGVTLYNDPHSLNGSNFMNNDLLSTLTLGITFEFWENKCDCKTFNFGSNKAKSKH